MGGKMSNEYKTAWMRNKRERLRVPRLCQICFEEVEVPRGGGQYRKFCLTCAPSLKWKSIASRYRLSKSMWEAMYFEQDGKCAIDMCPREAVVVDHDHTSEAVRALLCQGCNAVIGNLERPGWLKSALTYLDEYH